MCPKGPLTEAFIPSFFFASSFPFITFVLTPFCLSFQAEPSFGIFKAKMRPLQSTQG